MLPDTVQTSPFVTCVYPHQTKVVNYQTDTLGGPAHPLFTDPGDAKYGIIGLDRKVVWRFDLNELAALETSAADPVPTSVLVERFGMALIADLVSEGWLQDPEDLCKEYWFRTGQIEITAHCNWRCNFCPVSIEPKAQATMAMPLFTEIIDKLSAIGTIEFVTFHFFNEPTLDRLFERRIQVLREYDMKLSLFTNATGLTPKKIETLREAGVVHHIIINLPTLSPEKFHILTGARSYDSCLKNINNAIAADFPIRIVVNGVGVELKQNLEMLRHRYESLGVDVQPTLTCDRGGELEGKYHQDLYVSGRLTGCSWPLNHANFSVTGDMFICCNDYHQREVFGNIREGSVHEIMTRPEAVRLRRRVFGIDDAPNDYVCRSCHNQTPDFAARGFRPLATFPLLTSERIGQVCRVK